ncbi:MAG: DUF1553 domain-containing protein [Verrucomicrobia bacterium]|nr:DUF1553 domain-containing protein [Verrucomicrobiota bacterium]
MDLRRSPAIKWVVGCLSLLLGLGPFSSSTRAAEPGLSDPAQHWAFRSVSRPPVPAAKTRSQNPIDAFVEEGLRAAGLQSSPPADRATLLRRLHLVLTGLPPHASEVLAFVQSTDPRAYDVTVDRLLASPRFGERWAQLWLDVVRYADTDGFEVNTERKNAWPYRDYVIDAFNRDTPYDRFVVEQLAGDSCGQDAATGFLVTAAALLPGQIGQDDASKRLARQDELSEMIVNVGQSFLGLTIGCARCHHHKFDPIPTRDYYSLQAILSGVRYGERASRTPSALALAREAEELKFKVAAMDDSLVRYEPPARPNSDPVPPAKPELNEARFPAQRARFVKFSVFDTATHPTLGLIEPCVDEFEIFTAGSTSSNVALASLGTKTRASGSRTSDSHQLAFLNDGRYGNSFSWMSDEAGKGWVLFEFAESQVVDRIRWSRDRDGVFKDRFPVAYAIAAGESPDQLQTVLERLPLRPPANARRNSDRFHAVSTRKLRFTISACSSLEPALDEIEVFTSGDNPLNAAPSQSGVVIKASGVYLDSPLHKPEHLIDGSYGSARNWISSTPGQGWVEIEFPREVNIDRVVWSTDRDRVVPDRVPTRYAIEILEPHGGWRRVADHTDRKEYASGAGPESGIHLSQLTPEAARSASRLMEEKRRLQSRIDALFARQRVFAGWFAEPEATRVLLRGDPEQPGEPVEPAIPAIFGSVPLNFATPEPDRRKTLAAWIRDPRHPLTARVWVNRIWQAWFGIGFVDTPNDFGVHGSRPTHPELLDWLARELMDSGWSLKRLNRLIAHSATFQQSSAIHREGLARDADNRLLWRFSARRMEAEFIRDAMLASSQELNLTMHGPGFNLFKSRGGLNGFPPVESFGHDGLRRMIYAHRVRMESESVFGAFDCPDAGQSTPRRRQSTTPLQALNLLNSPFTFDRANALAGKVRANLGDSTPPEAGVAQVYLRVLGRHPSGVELSAAEPAVREHGLALLARVLFNTTEFLLIP